MTTKIHALVDAVGRLIVLKLTEGQAHDGRSATDMLDGVGAGQTLLADRAYDSDALRDKLTDRRAMANIRLMPNRKHLPTLDAKPYKRRNHAEMFFRNIRHFRAEATRYDKGDDNFLACVQLESLRIWLRTYESVT